jgi:hypothetical protein
MSWETIGFIVGLVSSVLGIIASSIGIISAFRRKNTSPDRYDDEEYERRGRRPRSREEARPAATRGIGCGTVALIVGGLLALGVGAVVVVAGIAGWLYLGTADEGKVNAARNGIARIEAGVRAHQAIQGSIPSSLYELTESQDGRPPSLVPQDLIDPWGREYSYEPDNLNREGTPRISTVTPSGKTIENWRR